MGCRLTSQLTSSSCFGCRRHMQYRILPVNILSLARSVRKKRILTGIPVYSAPMTFCRRIDAVFLFG
ncbi:UNVERIFIED_ORG: hypothetical protein M2414_005345 [Rahnella aquatilis]